MTHPETIYYSSKSAKVTDRVIRVGNVSVPTSEVAAVEIVKAADAVKVAGGALVAWFVAVVAAGIEAPAGLVGAVALSAILLTVGAVMPAKQLLLHAKSGRITTELRSIKTREIDSIRLAIESAIVTARQ